MAANCTLNNGRLDLWTEDRAKPPNYPLNVPITLVTIPFTYYSHGGNIRRIVGRLSHAYHDTVGNTLGRIESLLKARNRDDNLLICLFVPSCTHFLSNALKSTFFPFSIHNMEKTNGCAAKVLLGIVALVVDLATLAFRLLTFIPMAIYQRCGNTPPAGIQVIEGSVDWRSGMISFPTNRNDKNYVSLG